MIFGAKALRKDLHIDPLLQLKEFLERRKCSAMPGSEDARGTARSHALVRERQEQVNVEAVQQAAGSEFCSGDDDDEVTDAMVQEEPGMCMQSKHEIRERNANMGQAAQAAAGEGLPPIGVHELRTLVIDTPSEAFRQVQRQDPPAAVEPLQVVKGGVGPSHTGHIPCMKFAL